MSEHKEPIPSMIYNASVGGHVTNSQQIIDENENKEQSQINSEVKQTLGQGGSVDSRIAAAVNTEKTRAEEVETAFDGRINTLEEAVGSGGSVDERIAAEGARHYIKSETYTKEEVNGMITTPNQKYVSVEATEQTTAATDVLPATGEADTIYRVANWDGSQYNTNCYSEYTWNTSTSSYIKLSTKNVGVDDVPTAGSQSLVKSGSIKACTDSKIDIESMNLYNTEDFLHNKTIDRQGNIIDNTGGGSVSNYIPINGKNITFNLIFNWYNSIAVYNEDYTFRRVILTEEHYTQYTYTYQAGDSYIRVCVLDNQVKMAFYGNSMKNYTPFNPIAKYLLNAKPYFAITNNLELNKRIKELYIEGSLNPSKYYGVYSCYHYNGHYQFYIMQSDTPDLAGTDIVAFYDSDQRPEGVIELESFVNNVKAYGVFSCIDEEQPYQYRELINIPYVQDLAYSPAIHLWLLERQKNVYVDKFGSGDFTKLSDAISYSLLHKDVVINIAPGEYDLVDELGADYFANMTNEYYQGLKLGNGVTLRSTGNGVVIKALYNGNNVNVGYQYSLFNIIGTCTVENISFIAYNTRYVIHDDLDTVHYPDVKDYIVSFKGCRFNHKGSTMYDITQSVPISIGGGCVKNSTHIFEECIFESEADIVTEDLSYHNSYNCNSKVIVNNCYFGGDKTIAGRASNLTAGTINWFVSNNRFGNQPKLYNPELIHVIEFGNIIDS